MIELPPDLIAALQAEADRQGKTVSEIASKAIKQWIKDWIDPEPWFGPDDAAQELEDTETEEIELPKEGETYLALWEGRHFHVKVKSVSPLYKPVVPPHDITVAALNEDGSEEVLTISGSLWKKLVEDFSLTMESASNPGFTGAPNACMTAENSPDRHG